MVAAVVDVAGRCPPRSVVIGVRRLTNATARVTQNVRYAAKMIGRGTIAAATDAALSKSKDSQVRRESSSICRHFDLDLRLAVLPTGQLPQRCPFVRLTYTTQYMNGGILYCQIAAKPFSTILEFC